jgi:hypothetical protein
MGDDLELVTASHLADVLEKKGPEALTKADIDLIIRVLKSSGIDPPEEIFRQLEEAKEKALSWKDLGFE